MRPKVIALIIAAAALGSPAAVQPGAVSDDADDATVAIIEPKGGLGSGMVVDLLKPENEALILTAYHVIKEYAGEKPKPVPFRFHGDGRVFTAEIVPVWTDVLEDLAIIQVKKQVIPDRVRAFELADSEVSEVDDSVSVIGHKIATGEEWFHVSGYIKQIGLAIELSCPSAGIGFSGGPVFENRKAIGVIKRVDEKTDRCYAANISMVRELMRRPLRNALFKWIEAAETQFSRYRDSQTETWMPRDLLPRNDYCSGFANYSVSCSFSPINTLEGGVASFNEMIGNVAKSLGDAWHEDDTLRAHFNRDGYRRVIFTTPGRKTQVYVDLDRSGEWYKVSVLVASGAR